MAMSGMDAAVIEGVARGLRSCADRVGTVVSTVETTVAGTQDNWWGPDAAKFAADWQSDRSLLSGLSASLMALSNEAFSQAAEQRRASAR